MVLQEGLGLLWKRIKVDSKENMDSVREALGKKWYMTEMVSFRALNSPTFSRPSGNVGLHLGAISERFGPDAEVIGDTFSQVFDLHPQGSASLHIYCHNLTDTWSARRGVCTGNTKMSRCCFLQATHSQALHK